MEEGYQNEQELEFTPNTNTCSRGKFFKKSILKQLNFLEKDILIPLPLFYILRHRFQPFPAYIPRSVFRETGILDQATVPSGTHHGNGSQ